MNRTLDFPMERFTYQETEGETVEAVALGFEILKSTISVMSAGDVSVTKPTGPVGVIATNKPNLSYQTYKRDALIINYVWHSYAGTENVNVKLRCFVQYNGPDIQAEFGFDAEGKRSRLNSDSYVVVNNPLSLETRTAPENWRRLGVAAYPVVSIPIEFRVDHPWPSDNHNETFMLVLSGMYGFGAAPGQSAIQNRRVVKN